VGVPKKTHQNLSLMIAGSVTLKMRRKCESVNQIVVLR